MTAFSIMQTMTIQPFQQMLIDVISDAFEKAGLEDMELYFEQLTPLAILSQTAEETDQTIEEVEQDVNEQMENPDEMEYEDKVDDINETTNDKIFE